MTRWPVILAPRWVKDPLWKAAKAVPSLDLNFARDKALSSLVTFTRASSGRYVDSQGVIRTATTNLQTWSEDFRNTADAGATRPWSYNTSSVTADNTTAPNGTTTADLIAGVAGTANKFLSSNIPTTAQGVYTFSVYLKQGTEQFVVVRLSDGSANGIKGRFDLAAGTVVVTNEGTATGQAASATAVGNGWYRCVVTCSVSSLPNSVMQPQLWLNNFASTSLTTNYFAWGAQLEQSSTVGEYIPTTSTINSAPRFDHNPTTGESLGLLVEESRTNLLLYSACDSNWPTGGFGTPTYNLGLSALGVFSGVQVASGGQNWHSIYRSGISLTASTVYAFTLFYRAGTSGRVRLTFRNNTTATETIVSGAVGSLAVGGSFAGTATLLSQYLCSDGLTYVVTGTFTPNGTSADHWYRIGPDSTTSGQTVIALGAQLEAGAFPTSYIPTTTATVTRSADVASISGSNFSSWYRQDEGTVFTDASVSYAVPASSFPLVVSLNDGTSNNRIESGYLTAGLGGYEVATGGISQVGLYPGANTQARKLATAYRVNDFAACLNNGALNTDLLGTVPIVDRLRLGNRVGGAGNDLFGTIRRLTYWPQRLSNPTIQSITQ